MRRGLATGLLAAETISYLAAVALGYLLAVYRSWFTATMIVVLLVVVVYGSWQRTKQIDRLIDDVNQARDVAGREQHAQGRALRTLRADSPTFADRFTESLQEARRDWQDMDPRKRTIAARLLTITARDRHGNR